MLRGDYATARARFAESLPMFQQIGDAQQHLVEAPRDFAGAHQADHQGRKRGRMFDHRL